MSSLEWIQCKYAFWYPLACKWRTLYYWTSTQFYWKQPTSTCRPYTYTCIHCSKYKLKAEHKTPQTFFLFIERSTYWLAYVHVVVYILLAMSIAIIYCKSICLFLSFFHLFVFVFIFIVFFFFVTITEMLSKKNKKHENLRLRKETIREGRERDREEP